MRGDVDVQRGDTANKSFAFVNALTNITSEPSGAEILVDGKTRGRTPLRLDLPARSHQLVAHLDGWPDEQQTIDVVANKRMQCISCLRMAASKSPARRAVQL